MANEDFKTYSTYKYEHQKTYQYVFDYFSEQILSRELKIDDKVPTERDIAEKLDVSRNSIREVMHMLEINGLLECKQGSGNYVRCEPLEYMIKFVNMIMALQNIDYGEIYHIRMAFETAALRLAMTQASQDEIDALHNILLQMDEIADPKESAKLDAEFHTCLIEASHNRLIILYAHMLQDLMYLFIEDYRIRIMADKQNADALRRAHWNIYDALVDKNFPAGSFAMQKHFDIVVEEMKRRLPEKAQ